MGVVGGIGGQAVAVVEQEVEQVGAVATAAFQSRSMVVDLDGMGVGRHGVAVRLGQARPVRMGDADEGTGRHRPGGKRDAGLVFCGRSEILRQAGGEHMPDVAVAVGGRVDFGTEDGGEAVGAERQRVGDRKAVGRQEVIRQAEEVVARLAIDPADLGRLKGAVGEVGVGVDVAPPELAGRGERVGAHGWCLLPMTTTAG